MRICVDLDGTLCATGADYATAEPYQDRIAYINDLRAAGHEITIYTARGMGAETDPRLATDVYPRMTLLQLRRWGVSYDRLCMTKRPADLYIDDRAVSALDWDAVQRRVTELTT